MQKLIGWGHNESRGLEKFVKKYVAEGDGN